MAQHHPSTGPPLPSTITTTPTAKANLLTLPLELRIQIYSYLLVCNAGVTIRSLFIRERYQTIFMTQERKDVSAGLPLLRVCRQIADEALPLLYRTPLWMCSCRLDGLASQIGTGNFACIARMDVAFDDLDTIVDSLLGRVSGGGGGGGDLCFENLEELRATGFQVSALSSSLCTGNGGRGDGGGGNATKGGRLEAIRLCELAQRILQLHPKLNTLVQQNSRHNGGSDAVDTTFGRVRWRFLADERRQVNSSDSEHVVDLPALIARLQGDFDANPGRVLSAYEFALKLKLKWNVDSQIPQNS